MKRSGSSFDLGAVVGAEIVFAAVIREVKLPPELDAYLRSLIEGYEVTAGLRSKANYHVPEIAIEYSNRLQAIRESNIDHTPKRSSKREYRLSPEGRLRRAEAMRTYWKSRKAKQMDVAFLGSSA